MKGRVRDLNKAPLSTSQEKEKKVYFCLFSKLKYARVYIHAYTYFKSDSPQSRQPSLPVCLISDANKAALHYDKDHFSITHCICKSISPTGTCVNGSVKHHTHPNCSAPLYACIHLQQNTFTAKDIFTKGIESELGSK